MSSKQKKTVYFVRHGQSVDNASPVFQSVDSPLSKKGIAQANSIAERLSVIEFEALIASPVQRAKETAEYISEKTDKKSYSPICLLSESSLMKSMVSLGPMKMLIKSGGHGKKPYIRRGSMSVMAKITMIQLPE